MKSGIFSNKIFLSLTKISFLFVIVLSSIAYVILYKNYSVKASPSEDDFVGKIVINDENVVFLGDSIFDYYALDDYYGEMRVVNSGVAGVTSDNVLYNLETRVYIYNPSKVVLLIGINDYLTNTSKEQIASNIQEIVRNIKKNRPHSEVYVLSIFPVRLDIYEKLYPNYASVMSNIEISKTNKLIKNVCKEESVTFIDLHKKLVDKNGDLKDEYTVDGLHISDIGYKVITDELFKYLRD